MYRSLTAESHVLYMKFGAISGRNKLKAGSYLIIELYRANYSTDIIQASGYETFYTVYKI